MADSGLNGVLELKSPEEIAAMHGLSEHGRAQMALDSEVLRLSDPYVPFKTGTLKNSGISGTDVGSGVVVYNAPYARKQYYGGRTPGSHPDKLRGRYWFERMKADHMDDLKRVVSAMLDGGDE